MNTEDIEFDAILVQRLPTGQDSVEVSRETLTQIWSDLSISGESAGFQAFEEAFLANAGERDALLHLRSHGWTLHLSRGALKASVMVPVVAASLQLAGATGGMAATILPLILPFLFEIERTTLSRKHEHILLELHRRVAAGSPRTNEQLYGLLPESIRLELNRLDFLDFLEAIENAGHAERGADEKVVLSAAGGGRLRISIQ